MPVLEGSMIHGSHILSVGLREELDSGSGPGIPIRWFRGTSSSLPWSGTRRWTPGAGPAGRAQTVRLPQGIGSPRDPEVPYAPLAAAGGVNDQAPQAVHRL